MGMAAFPPVRGRHADVRARICRSCFRARWRLLHERIRWRSAMAASRRASRRGSDGRADGAHDLALRSRRWTGDIRANGEVPPERAALVLAVDRRRPGASRQGSRRRADVARAPAVRPRQSAGVLGIDQPAKHFPLPAPRLRRLSARYKSVQRRHSCPCCDGRSEAFVAAPHRTAHKPITAAVPGAVSALTCLLSCRNFAPALGLVPWVSEISGTQGCIGLWVPALGLTPSAGMTMRRWSLNSIKSEFGLD